MKTNYIFLFLLIIIIPAYYSCQETTAISELIPPSFSGEFYPEEHQEISNRKPALVVKNFTDFNGKPLVYDFQLFAEGWKKIIDQVTDVPEGEEYTSWQVTVKLDFGTKYYWRVRAKNDKVEGPWSVKADFRIKSIFPPHPFYPGEGETIDSQYPTVCVENSQGIQGQRTYAFQIYADEELTTLLVSQENVVETQEYTCWKSNVLLPSNEVYYWRCRGYINGEYSNWSNLVSFYLCACKSGGGTPYAEDVVENNVDDCDGINKHMNAWEALGPPDASGVSTPTYRGFVSLGLGGYIILDMNVCIYDGPGADLLVYQYVSNEKIEVQVSSCPDGTYYSLGTYPCPHPVCGFDVGNIPLNQIRYVKIIDRSDPIYCYEHVGADIDAVQAINYQ